MWHVISAPPPTAEEVEVYYHSSDSIGLAYYMHGSWHFHFGTSYPDFWRWKRGKPA